MTRTSAAPAATAPPRLAWWGCLWWAATGALLSFGAVSIVTVGVFLLPIGWGLAAGGILWGRLRNRSVIGLPAGMAAAPLYIAWLNREGPGTICRTFQDGSTCSERWSPWPFVAVALLLLAIVVVGAARARRPR